MRRGLRLVYSVSEAAELLGIGRSTAYELVARGELPSVAIGHRRVITRPTLTELLGVEPPLPAELDAARIAANDAPKRPATQHVAASQPRPIRCVSTDSVRVVDGAVAWQSVEGEAARQGSRVQVGDVTGRPEEDVFGSATLGSALFLRSRADGVVGERSRRPAALLLLCSRFAAAGFMPEIRCDPPGFG